MYLAQLKISNFRKLAEADLQFQPGLNVIVGANNVGKTAVVDALRALLAGHDEPYVAITRARNLLWLGVPANALKELRPALVAHGFTEVGNV